MKTLLILIALCSTVYAQPYLAISGASKNVGLSVGVLIENKLDMSIGYNVPYKRSVFIPFLYHANVGYTIFLTQKEEINSNYSITPSISAAYSMVKKISKSEDTIIDDNGIKAKYRIEVGKDAHLGRFFISANYCGFSYYEFGIRAFIR